MRILVTGALGFIGRHLSAELADHGHEVVPHDHEHGDLLAVGEIEAALNDARPDVCVHLAAHVGRLFGEDNVLRTVTENGGMTALVAKACGERGVRVAYASTSEVYGDCAGTTVEETDLRVAPLPHNIYGLSKRWGEEACRLYAPHGLTVLRFSMPYGPGHPPGRGRAAIVNMLHQAENRQTIPVHRGSERSWCWIGDTTRATRLILESGMGGVWNVGRDDAAVPMLMVAELACELTGAPPSLIELVDAPARQTVVKRLATGKLRALGWRPEVELREGMAQTLMWLRQREAVAA